MSTRIKINKTPPKSYPDTIYSNPYSSSTNGNIGICLNSLNKQRIFAIDGISVLQKVATTSSLVESIDTVKNNDSSLNQQHILSVFIGNKVTDIIGLTTKPLDGLTQTQTNKIEYCEFQEPSMVSSIAEFIVHNNSISSIKLPESLKKIDDKAFYACNNLISIEIPSSVTDIKNYAFSHCFSLSSVIFQENSALSYVGVEAFGNAGLTSVELLDNVTYNYTTFLHSKNISDFYLNTAQSSIAKFSKNEQNVGNMYFFSKFSKELLEDQYTTEFSSYHIPDDTYKSIATSFLCGDYKIHVPTAMYKPWINTWEDLSDHIVPYGEYVPENQEEIEYTLDPSKTYFITDNKTAALKLSQNVIDGETASISAFDIVDEDDVVNEV